MKKAMFGMILLLVGMLTGCQCKHVWIEADCVTAKTCSECGEVQGKPLDHEWMDADCETPKTCSRCLAVTGPALGHRWIEADCELAKHCTRCDAAEGEALGHEWQDADCENPKICVNCRKQVGEPVGHLWRENDSHTRKYCRVCMAEAPGSLTLEQVYPAGELRFADGRFLMDSEDYLQLYLSALEEAGYQYDLEDTVGTAAGHPVYTLTEATTGNEISVLFIYDSDDKLAVISAECDVGWQDETLLEQIMDAANLAFDVAHGAMTVNKWHQMGAEGSALEITDHFMHRAVCDGLGCITSIDFANWRYEVVAAADPSEISYFTMEAE